MVFGIGNRSRGDDAAGPLLVEGLAGWLEREGLGAQVDCLEEYQLQPEHALDLLGRRLALFVDARSGLVPAVRLDIADHDVGARRFRAKSRLEHRIGLADTGRGAEEHPQPSALRTRLLGLYLGEELVRIGAVFHHA